MKTVIFIFLTMFFAAYAQSAPEACPNLAGKFTNVTVTIEVTQVLENVLSKFHFVQTRAERNKIEKDFVLVADGVTHENPSDTLGTVVELTQCTGGKLSFQQNMKGVPFVDEAQYFLDAAGNLLTAEGLHQLGEALSEKPLQFKRQ